MDRDKTAALLLRLRQEHGLTQRQLAEALYISDKTVSKWERGAGLPDITMLGALSRIFRVDAEQLLAGELPPGQTDGGNMKRVKFYVCPACGNTLTATGGREISCCGRKLAPLEAQEAAGEHLPTVEEVELDYYISFPHEMRKEHYLSFAACLDLDRLLLIKLYPEQAAALRFPRMPAAKEFYFHCNQHGLFHLRLP